MARFTIPQREAQALREVGRTEVAPIVARLLSVCFLATISLVSLVDGVAARRGTGEDPAGGPFRLLGAGLPRAGRLAVREGPLAANRELLAVLDAFEERVEAESVLRSSLLPPVQRLLTARLGLGNEQAYLGRDGWLFYRPDVDYAAGRGFLEPAVQRERARGGDAWLEPPQPDPVAALVDFHRQLAARGVRLLVLPVPVKPVIRPERFSLRPENPARPAQNPSYRPFLQALEAEGVEVLDVEPLLWRARAEGDLFLRTDTHWTPQAMDRVAAELAARIAPDVTLAAGGEGGFLRREAVIQNVGDIVVMLRLARSQTLFPAEEATVAPVTDLEGVPWRPDRQAEILLLGDSFTNVYSEPGLGWGAGAGLAEQLAFHLQRTVDRIALNAGGSYATRQALSRELASGQDRLAGKRVVVYQFAARELAIGDWKRIPLADADVR